MNPISHLARLSLKAYKLGVSPVLHSLAGPLCGCRFSPTCSEYAAEAIERHGFFAGARMAVGRLCRCHPWGEPGYDPVPDAAASAKSPGGVDSQPQTASRRRECASLTGL